MTSETRRDPSTDTLLTPENAALVVIDFQPTQVSVIRSMDEALLADDVELDRTQINAWEDVEFRAAIEATGRRKLLMCALWAEARLAYPTLEALREGFEDYPVVDAVGGTSEDAHRAGLRRVEHAAAQLVSWASVACELQRGWARTETAGKIRDIVVVDRLLKGE